MQPLVSALVLALASTFPVWGEPNGASAALVIKPANITNTLVIAGTIEGKEMSEARVRIPGTLESVLVARGTWVKKGQVLGVVRDEKIGQQSESLKTQLAAAEKNLQRLKELLPLDAASPLEVEQAEAQAAALRAQAQNTNQSRADGQVLAPSDGQFVALHAASGTVVMPGESMGTVATFPLLLKISMPENQVRHMTVGDQVTFQALADHPLEKATVTQIYPEVQAGRVTVEAQLSASPSVLVGSKVKTFVAAGTRTAIVVPQDFIRWRNGLAYATLKKGGEILVQTGYPQADGSLEILSGLTQGDALIKP